MTAASSSVDGARAGSNGAALAAHVQSAAAARRRVLEEIQTLSESEVLAVGTLLREIRAESKQQVADLDALQRCVNGGGPGQTSLRASADEQELAVGSFSAFCDATELRLHEQAEAARKAAGSARQIVNVAQRVGQLGSTARMVALNARVESSRLGAAGAPFSVLAMEIRQLTDAILAMSDEIEAFGERLSADIPHIAESAQQLLAQHREVGGQLKERMRHVMATQGASIAVVGETASAGFERADRIVEKLRSALERLQFQDRIAQNVHAVLIQDEKSTALVAAGLLGSEAGAADDLASRVEEAEYLSHARSDDERHERLAQERAGDADSFTQGDAVFF
jgi:methyl-accepting chemotaxis protein